VIRRRASDTAPRRGRELQRELLPLAPFLYLVWADGSLSREDLAAIRDVAARSRALDEDGRALLRAWLDPAQPPTAAELSRLLELVKEYGGATADGGADGDLVRLGERIARNAECVAGEHVPELLAELQTILGVAGTEAVRSLMQPEQTSADAPAPAPAFDPARLNAYIDADALDVRRRVLGLLASDDFAFVDPRDTAAYREQVLAWCRHLADAGIGPLAFPAEFGGRDDVIASIAAFETIAFHDLSLLVKYGVHFGLFGGSIYLLGTRTHHERWLRDVATLALPGCFAMTETGHGSNVRDIRTTARYDSDRGVFVLHTPDPSARKDYIGNAALHGRMAVVFAQLVTDTGEHGVHAFAVAIRDEQGRVLPGIGIEDCGLKAGLNGVDNGRISFADVVVPRDHLLDRYGSVSEGGAYTSPIPGAGRRFFTMLGTLVAGRISIACASLSAAKTGLAIAVRYADRRRQFGPEGAPEVPILDYTTMQRRLLPRLATAYALDFALSALVRQYARQGEDDAREVETLAAALKAWASDWTVETLQECREACGGQGYLSSNRIGALRADTDVFTTFEGANHVLYQLVARGRLTEYRDQFGELKLWSVARIIAARATTRVTELNPISTRRTDREHLLDPEFHAAALRYREERLLASLARRLRQRINGGMDSFDALNECQDHAVELGRAFAERFILEQFHAAVEACPDPALRSELRRLAVLFGLDRLEAASGWLQESGYTEAGKAKAIRASINDLCREIRPAATALAAGFGIPDRLLAGLPETSV
jgi:acyl-CoA oxidase